jgi:prevent-host-death family protein
MQVNIHEAKTHLSRLLKRVAAGEEITISRAGVPVAKLIASRAQSKSRPMGMDRGKIWMADDFDRPDPKLEALFYGPITTGAPEMPAAPKTRPGRKKKP